MFTYCCSVYTSTCTSHLCFELTMSIHVCSQIFSELHLIYRLSVTIPSISTNALGYGAFLGLYANLRYQLLCGFDRAVVHHFDVIGVALVFSTALRYVAFSLITFKAFLTFFFS